MTSTNHSVSRFIVDVLRFALIALIIVVPFRIFIAQPFIVNGQSMDPSFDTGEYLIIDQLSYRFQEPARGDVIVFRFPKQPSTFFIKRVIGLPGETVTIESGEVTIYNDAHPDGLQLREPYVTHDSSGSISASLGPDEFFVLGDNRTASLDSRSWGALEREFIQGRPLMRLFPLSEIDFMPGAFQS